MTDNISLNEKFLIFIEKVFGRIKQIDSKGNVEVDCPNCYQTNCKLGIFTRKYNLSINLDKKIGHCWACGFNFFKILRDFCKKTDFEIFLKQFAKFSVLLEPKTNEEEKVEIPDNFKLLIEDDQSFLAKKSLSYLFSRGLTERDLWFFRFGTANENWLWKNRVIMPSFDLNGDLNYLCGRDIFNVEQYKYKVSKNNTQNVIFNEFHICWDEELTIVEGIFDLVKCGDNAIPLLGSNFNKNSLLFHKIIENKTPILLGLDPDMTLMNMIDNKFSSKVSRLADLFVSNGIRVRIMDFKSKNDIGSLTKKEVKKLSKEAKIWNYDKRIKDKLNNIKAISII